jgi:hypothetical protein
VSIDGERAEAVVPASSASAAPSAQRPDAVARILSAAIVGTLAGVVTAKFFGPKAGFIGLVAGAAAHEMFDAPLARHLGALGL